MMVTTKIWMKMMIMMVHAEYKEVMMVTTKIRMKK